MKETLADLLLASGYPLIFLAPCLEYAGLPIPGDATLFWASVLARLGHFDLAWVIGMATAGAIVGDNIGYWIGKRGGRPLLERWAARLPSLGRSLQWSEAYFRRHGGKTVVIARFIPALRVCGALTSGVSLMPWRRFLLFNVLGAVLWGLVTGGLGYTLGLHAQWLYDATESAWIVAALGAPVMALFVYAQYRLFRRGDPHA
jgi:undecaprenyl-diphosphatase